MSGFWYYRNYWNEGRAWLDKLFEGADAPPTAAFAQALAADGFLTGIQGDPARGIAMQEQAEGWARQLTDPHALVWPLTWTSALRLLLGDLPAAEHAAGELVQASAAVEFPWGVAQGQFVVGAAKLLQGKLDEAMAVLEPALEQSWQIGDRIIIATCLSFLGQAAAQGDFTLAAGRFAKAIELYQELHNRGPWSLSLKMWGQMALRAGDVVDATARFADGLAVASEIGKRPDIAGHLSGLGCVAASRQLPEEAIRLMAASNALREKIGVRVGGPERALEESSLAAARSQITPTAFEDAWAAGGTMPLDAAVALAEDVARRVTAPAG